MHRTQTDSPSVLPTERSQSFYKVLRDCSRAVVQSTSQQQLFHLISQALLALGGIKAAQIGALKVKACKVTVQRELGRFHLVTHRGKRPLCVFGLQQMLDQPARGLDVASHKRLAT